MPDLIEKYFTQDLTEEEDRALTQELLDSDQASEKFLRLAEEAYVRFGLPPADWQGAVPRILPKPKAGWANWFGLSVLVLGLGAGFYYWRHSKPLMSASQAIGQNHAAPGAPGFTAPQHQAPSMPDNRLAEREKGPATSSPTIGGNVASPAHLTPKTQGEGPPESVAPAMPPSQSQGGSPAFSKLSVDVSLSKPATLTVRVLDHHGTAVALLYEGPVAMGQWTFKWNGKTSDGGPAPPGYYQIEVNSGAHTQRKNVQIH